MLKTLTVAGLATAALVLAPLGGSAEAATLSSAATVKSVPGVSMVDKVQHRYTHRRVYRPVVRYHRPWRPIYVYRPYRPYYVYRRPRVVISAGIPLYAGYYTYRTSCSYYYRKWKHTGSRYWRGRYYRCRGWW